MERWKRARRSMLLVPVILSLVAFLTTCGREDLPTRTPRPGRSVSTQAQSIRVPLFLQDWRNPSRWTANDRRRAANLVSASSRWTEDPIRGVPTLVAYSAGYDTWGGVLLPAGDILGDLGRLVVSHRWDLIEGRRRMMWASAPETLWAIDCRNPDAMRALADLLVERCPWAEGIHHDYGGNPLWMSSFADLATRDPAWVSRFNQQWDAGLSVFAARIHQRRPDWQVVWQQFHYVPAWYMTEGNGRFVEQAPTAFGMTWDKHRYEIGRERQIQALAHPGKPLTFVFSLLKPTTMSSSYIDATKKLCRDTGAYLAWGRDAAANVGYVP